MNEKPFISKESSGFSPSSQINREKAYNLFVKSKKRNNESTTLTHYYWGIMFFVRFSLTPFISSLLCCKTSAGYNQFQFSWLNIVHQSAWCIHEKAYRGTSSFFYSYVIQKFAVEIWMTRIKLWNAGVNASFVLLALRKYLRAKEGTLMKRKGFFYSFLSNVSYPDFWTAKHQLITNSKLLDWRLCNKACETRLIQGNNKKAYWGIKWFFTLFFHTSHIS